jgi:hypothetical protein
MPEWNKNINLFVPSESSLRVYCAQDPDRRDGLTEHGVLALEHLLRTLQDESGCLLWASGEKILGELHMDATDVSPTLAETEDLVIGQVCSTILDAIVDVCRCVCICLQASSCVHACPDVLT